MKILFSSGAGVLALSLATAAGAIPVDFRDPSFSAGHGVNHFEHSAASYDFNFDALRISDMQHEGTLFWDGLDGFGIKNSKNWDADEIEGSEVLKLSFGESIHLGSFTVADLFIETGVAEHGLFSVDDGSHWSHFFADGVSLNGEVTVNVNAETDDILFMSAGATGVRQGHEFSVVAADLGRQQNGPSVPEPSAALLFAAGAVVVGRRNRRA